MNRQNIGDVLIQGVQEAIQYARGYKRGTITHRIMIPENIDVLSIRRRMKLSRPDFAKQFGFNYKTVQHWERGDRKPRGPAKILLAILEKRPDVIECLKNGKTVRRKKIPNVKVRKKEAG